MSGTPAPARSRWHAGVAAVCALVLIILPAPLALAATGATAVEVLATRLVSDREVSVVLALPSVATASQASVTVTASTTGSQVAARADPVVSERSAVAVVLDASSAAVPALRGGALSGAANYLLRLPSGATTTVIADQRPPRVVTAPSGGVADDLRAISAWTGEGERTTSTALTLAVRQLRQLPRVPADSAVIVLYTSGTPADDESAPALAERLSAAGVILAVVDASGDPSYWPTVAKRTGGVSVSAVRPGASVEAFDAVDDELRRRVVVTFPRPAAAARVRLQIVDAGRAASVDVDLPPEATGSDPEPAAGGSRGEFGLGPWLVGGLLVVAGAAAITVIARRRRPAPAPEQGSTPGTATTDLLQTPPAPPEDLFRAAVPEAEVRELEELVAREPANPHHRRNLAAGYERLAGRDRAERRMALAASGYRQAVDALAARTRLEPDNPQARLDLALAQVQLADLDAEQGWTGQARAGYLQAIELCEGLITTDSESADPHRQLLMRLQARLATFDEP